MRAGATTAGGGGGRRGGWRPYAVIALAAAAFWAMPVAVSSGIHLDDAELLAIVQSWRLAYDTSQPPLYGWLWQAASSAFGVSLASAQLVRVAIVGLFFCTVYRLGTRIASGALAPAVLASTYLYLPLFAWEGSHYQTHTLLLCLMTVALLLALVETRRRPSPSRFIALGIVGGLGLLSKYTFVAVLAASGIAALAVPAYRRQLLRPAAILSVGVMLAIALPPAAAILLRLGDVAALPRLTQEITDAGENLSRRAGLGVLRLFEETLIQSALLLTVLAALWGRAMARTGLGAAWARPDLRFFAVQGCASFAMALVAVAALGITRVESHHVLPLIIPLPIVAVLAADAAGLLAPGRRRARAFVGGAALIAGAVWSLLLWNLLAVFPNRIPDYSLAAAAIRALGGREATVIAETYRMAGTLRIREPGFTVYAMDIGDRVAVPPRPPRAGGCIALWRAREGGAPPQAFIRYVEAITGRRWAAPGEDAKAMASGASGRHAEQLRVEPLPPGGLCGVAAPGG